MNYVSNQIMQANESEFNAKSFDNGYVEMDSVTISKRNVSFWRATDEGLDAALMTQFVRRSFKAKIKSEEMVTGAQKKDSPLTRRKSI